MEYFQVTDVPSVVAAFSIIFLLHNNHKYLLQILNHEHVWKSASERIGASKMDIKHRFSVTDCMHFLYFVD